MKAKKEMMESGNLQEEQENNSASRRAIGQADATQYDLSQIQTMIE